MKAIKSVMDVMVIATPVVLIVYTILSSTEPLSGASVSPESRMNMSSTPIPKTKHKMIG